MYSASLLCFPPKSNQLNLMYKEQKVLGFIPARGGSKGIPKKNISLLSGKPLIQYTFDQVKLSNLLDLVTVSTDDPEIVHIAETNDISVVVRPHELSTDTASTESAIIHCLDTLSLSGLIFDYVVVLEPTSPFRSIDTVDSCIKHLIDSSYNSLLTVKPSTQNIGYLSSGCFLPLNPHAPRRRQDRAPYYIETSTVYVASTQLLYETNSLPTTDWCAYIISEEEAIDINTFFDLAFAEFLLNKNS